MNRRRHPWRSAFPLLLAVCIGLALPARGQMGVFLPPVGHLQTGATERARFGCQQESVEACVQRLRTALRAELSASELALVEVPKPLSVTCHHPRHLQGEVEDGACMPVAGIIPDELRTLGPLAAVSTPELVGALHWGNDSLASVAFRAPAAFPSPEAALDVLSAGGPISKVAFSDVVNFLEHGSWRDRAEAATLLGELGDPRAIEPLRRALLHPPASAQAAAPKALARFQGTAAPAVGDLESLSAEHWSWNVRREAADAATAISGHTVSPRMPHCQTYKHAQETPGHWTFPVDSKETELVGLDATSGGFTERPEATLDDGTRILFTNKWEWGGAIVAESGSGRRVLRQGHGLNPLRAVSTPSGYFIIEGTLFGSNRGSVMRLSPDAKGAWQAEPVLELAGAPRAFAVTPAGALLLLTEDASVPFACPTLPGHARSRPVYLLRITPDGAVASLP